MPSTPPQANWPGSSAPVAPFTPHPAIANGAVYIGSLDKNFYVLDALTGTEIWHFTGGAAFVSWRRWWTK